MKFPDKITLKYYGAFTYLGLNADKMNLEKMVIFLTLFYGEKYRADIRRMSYNNVLKIFEITVLRLESELKDKNAKPPKKLTLGGKNYKLINIDKPTIGWLIDASGVNENTPAYILAGLCYCPENSYYGEVDVHDNLTYPLSELREVFENEMLLVNYLQVNRFFLRKSMNLVKSSIVQVRVMIALKKVKKMLMKLYRKRLIVG